VRKPHMKNNEVTTVRAALFVLLDSGIETPLGETFALATGMGLCSFAKD
jgi:hypothetical protein